MNTILYVNGRGRYWLATLSITLHPGVTGEGRDIYFRRDSDSLHRDTPTWFDDRHEAIAAAEEMGFTVLEG